MESDEEVAARRLGQVVGGKWCLERLLGTGGMAAVYAARAPDGATAAIKMLHPEMTLKRDVRERFVREAYVGNKVQHPGAVRILEHGASEGEAYLVMELLDGEPLGERVRRLGALPVPELLDYLDQVLDVLARAHEQGIIHRDIKPDNLFVGDDGRVKILDFGLARMLDDVPGEFKTRTGLALGTLPYMAPEQALGKRGELDGRADLFALGATAFRILARRKVHEADSEAELLVAMATKPAPALASVAPDVPQEVCSIIDLSLAFSKDARYPDARTMQTDVRAALANQTPPYAVGRGVATARDLPTRVDRVAPAVPGAVEPAPHSSAPSLPSVPHVVAAGARAASTALMPAVEGRAAPDAPTRADAPAAPATQPLGAPQEAPPASLGPASLPQAGVASSYSAGGSQPPPAKPKSGLPLVLLALAALLFVGVLVIGAVLLTQTDALSFGSESAPAVAAPAPASDNAEPTSADPADDPAAQSAGASEPSADDTAEQGPAAPTKQPASASKPRSATAAAPTATPKPSLPPRPTAAASMAPAPAPPPAAPADPGRDPDGDDREDKDDDGKGKTGKTGKKGKKGRGK